MNIIKKRGCYHCSLPRVFLSFARVHLKPVSQTSWAKVFEITTRFAIHDQFRNDLTGNRAQRIPQQLCTRHDCVLDVWQLIRRGNASGAHGRIHACVKIGGEEPMDGDMDLNESHAACTRLGSALMRSADSQSPRALIYPRPHNRSRQSRTNTPIHQLWGKLPSVFEIEGLQRKQRRGVAFDRF